MAKAPTTYVPNAATARTRNVDALSFPFTGKPQAMTVYVRLIQMTENASPSQTIVATTLTNTVPRFIVDYVNSTFRVTHQNLGSILTSTVADGAVGDTVELIAVLYADGSVKISSSVNGGTVTAGAQSAASPLGSAWNTPTLYFAGAFSGGLSTTTVGLRDVLVVRGVHTLETMRKRAGQ